MSRSVAAIAGELRSLQPPGWLWPTHEDSILNRLFYEPLAGPLADVEANAEAMMEEIDPRSAALCIGDFERVLGPDPCGRDTSTMTLAQRQALAHQRWTARGGASRAYFIGLAGRRGVAITITEFRTSQCDTFQCGDEIIETPEQFVWQVNLTLGDWSIFETGAGEAGELLYAFDLSDIECDIRRAAPAHTEVVFNYVEPSLVGQPLGLLLTLTQAA